MKKKYIITEEEYQEIKRAVKDTLHLWQYETISAESSDEDGELIASIGMSKETFFEQLRGQFIIREL